MSSHLFLVTVTAFCLTRVSAQGQPLLSTIATVPELSTFSSVVNASGGNQLNPALEERFNSVLDGRKYTALVPTNDVRDRCVFRAASCQLTVIGLCQGLA